MTGALLGALFSFTVWVFWLSIKQERSDSQIRTIEDKLDCIERHNHESIEMLNDFIKRNCPPCPECGESGLDCHNYQG